MTENSLELGTEGDWPLRYESAFTSCPFGIHIYLQTSGGKLVFASANAAADAILGVENRQFIGKTLEEAFPPLAETEIPERYGQIMATGKPWHTERITYEHGAISGAYEVHAYKGGPDCLVVLFADVTERKRAEVARIQSERYLKALNESAQLLLLDLDADVYCGFAGNVGASSEAERLAIYVFSDDDNDPEVLDARAIWHANQAQMAEFATQCRDTNAGVLRRWLDELLQGENRLGRICELPAEQKLLFDRDDGWYVLLPLNIGGDALGAMVLDRSAHSAQWDELEVGFLRIAAADLARALERARNQQFLRESEERFRSIVHEMSDIVWLVDQDIRIRYATPSCFRVLGHDPESLVGRCGLDFVHPADVPVVMHDFQEVVDRMNPYTPTIFRFKHAEGHWLFLESTGVNLLDRPGMEGILLTTRDVSDRRKVEERVRFTQFAVDRISDAVYLYKRVGPFFYVNRAACESLGYTEDELLQLSVPDIDPEFPDEKSDGMFSELRKTGAMRFETSHRRKDGTDFPVEVSLNMVAYEGEDFICAFARDISARKRAELELLRSEERFRSLIENVSDVVATIREDGTIEYVSPAVEKVVGFGGEASVGTNVLDYVHPDDLPAARAGLNRVFTSPKAPNKLECRIRHVDGTFRHVDVVGSQFVNQRGEVRGVIMYRDVTDRFLAEQERRELEAQLRQSQKLEAVGQLAGGVAHDFNNLLTAIRGYTELSLSDLPDGHPLSDYLNESIRACARAETLVRQLLLFSRRSDPQFQTINLDEVVAGMGKMLKRLLGEHIDLHILPSPESLTIRADTGQIEQILINLCVNARDALHAGGTIRVATYSAKLDDAYCREHSWARAGEHCILEVSDTGAGIPAADMDRIFDPFFTTKGVGQGTGLGLATVYGITTNHRGLIQVESEVGSGTSFRIYLPRTTSQSESEMSDDQAAIPHGSGQTILLAEDDPQVRALAIRILEHAGYRVISAETGDEAVEAFHRHARQIDACVIDVVMPRLSGRQVREQIRAARPTMPVLHVTGYDFNILDREIAPEEGVPLLMKPFTRTELLIKIRELLG